MILPFINTHLIKTYNVVHIHIDENGTVFHVLQVFRDKTSLQIKEQNCYDDFNELTTYLKKSIPIIVCFTGKKIISKAVEKQANYLDKVLFNKSPDDFYIYEIEKEEQILLSVARKNDIDVFLDKFREVGISVCSFSIGPYVLETLKSVMPEVKIIENDSIIYNFENSKFEVKEKNSTNESGDVIQIGDDSIEANQVIAFSGFLNYIQGGLAKTNFEGLVSTLEEESGYRKLFRLAGIFTLAVFMVLLTLSYSMRSIYSDKSAAIQEELTLKNLQLNKIQTLEKDKEYKQSIISNSSLGTSEYLSFYISNLAEKVPEDILLENLNLFPASEAKNEDESIEITPKLVVLTGVTASKHSVHNWLKLLDSYAWIRKTEIASYVYVKNEYEFIINIFL